MPKFSLEFVIGILVTLILAALPIFLEWRKKQKKNLICNRLQSVAIASLIPETSQHRISILYERDGYDPVNIQGAYVRFVRIANVGRTPIRREDIAPIDPLKLVVRYGRVLDLSVEGVSRNTINFAVNTVIEEDEYSSTTLTFDFLDYMDGALIRVVTDDPESGLLIKGTIIGMPDGIKYQSDSNLGSSCIAMIFVILYMAMLFTWLALFSPRVPTNIDHSKVETSSWFTSLISIILLFGVPGIILWLSQRFFNGPSWNNELLVPSWFAKNNSTESSEW